MTNESREIQFRSRGISTPFIGLLFLQGMVFWFQVRPAIPEAAVRQAVVGIITVSVIAGVFNAARYMQKIYKR